MIRNVMILAGAIVLIGGYTWYADYQGTPSSTPAPSDAATNTAMAPDFTFQSLGGKDYKLSQFRGKPIVLNFWASWCAPCIVEFPQMVKLAALKKDAVFVFISTDDSGEPIERFVSRYGKNLPANVLIGTDFHKTISQDLYQTFKVPETYLIDSNGMLLEKIVGADIDWLSPDVQQKLDGLQAP